MFEKIGNAIISGILYVVALIFYYIEAGIGKLLDKIYSMFGVFAGITSVSYKGNNTYLPDVFVSNETITTLYWGMAMIGLCLLFAFAIVSVIRKLFDSTGEHVKQSYGYILTSTFKSALYILLMTAIVLAVLTATSVVLESVDDLFNNADEIANPSTITFTDEDYGNMFRVIDTIGSYSVNPSPTNRYNINILFNEICSDLQTLEDSGMFRFSYSDAQSSWQYALRKIYLAGDINSGIPVDQYNTAVSNAITYCMDQIKYNSNFAPLKKYVGKKYIEDSSNSGSLGTMLMLSCTLKAANNEDYNGDDASITDNLRKNFYNGSLDIFDRDQCEEYFSIRFGSWDHIVCLVTLTVALIEFAKIILNCIARIFNIVFLYIVAPPFIAVSPLDDGQKFKQWITAFVVQSCSIFGVYISVRLMMIFIPIVMDNSLVLFSNSVINILAKDIMAISIVITARKASLIFNGILSDNAGMQSLMAGDIGSSMLGQVYNAGRSAVGTGLSIGKGVAKGFSDVTGLTTLGNKISDVAQSMRDHWGIVGAGMNGFKPGKSGGGAGGGAEGKTTNEKTQKLNAMAGKKGAVASALKQQSAIRGTGVKSNSSSVKPLPQRNSTATPGNNDNVTTSGNNDNFTTPRANEFSIFNDKNQDDFSGKTPDPDTIGANENDMNNIDDDIFNFDFKGFETSDNFNVKNIPTENKVDNQNRDN